MLHIVTYLLFSRPTLPSRCLMYFWGGIPLLNRHPFHQHMSCKQTGSYAHLGVTYLHPSISMFPAMPLPFPVHAPPLRPSLAPIKTDRFLSSPQPCRCQNFFYHDLQLLMRCRLPPPRYPESVSSLITHVSCTNVTNRPYGHPIHHCCLPI